MKSAEARVWERDARAVCDSMLTALGAANRAIRKGDQTAATRWEVQYNRLYRQLMTMIEKMPHTARAPLPPRKS